MKKAKKTGKTREPGMGGSMFPRRCEAGPSCRGGREGKKKEGKREIRMVIKVGKKYSL